MLGRNCVDCETQPIWIHEEDEKWVHIIFSPRNFSFRNNKSTENKSWSKHLTIASILSVILCVCVWFFLSTSRTAIANCDRWERLWLYKGKTINRIACSEWITPKICQLILLSGLKKSAHGLNCHQEEARSIIWVCELYGQKPTSSKNIK